jgi:Uma2 family endonuclease
VNLNDDTIEVYRRPSGGSYEEVRRLGRGDRISPEAFPDLELEVRVILLLE